MIKELQKKLLGKNNYNELLIKKLKKENEKLKREIFWLEQENIDKNECIEAYLSMLDERDNRIQKAIEYIENNKQIAMFADLRKEGTHQYTIECDADDLLDILTGGKNDK